ncbi:MAG: hypothetical protein NC084_03860 [Bacteroides sp.]|nr:hypothetical protein [Eubacterium sp.]MCM1417699.1 hypothetical protein [Roseburia sp.]MCM1461835.1 hypothetical protein [Bacteroides sp.]
MTEQALIELLCFCLRNIFQFLILYTAMVVALTPRFNPILTVVGLTAANNLLEWNLWEGANIIGSMIAFFVPALFLFQEKEPLRLFRRDPFGGYHFD